DGENNFVIDTKNKLGFIEQRSPIDGAIESKKDMRYGETISGTIPDQNVKALMAIFASKQEDKWESLKKAIQEGWSPLSLMEFKYQNFENHTSDHQTFGSVYLRRLNVPTLTTTRLYQKN